MKHLDKKMPNSVRLSKLRKGDRFTRAPHPCVWVVDLVGEKWIYACSDMSGPAVFRPESWVHKEEKIA